MKNYLKNIIISFFISIILIFVFSIIMTNTNLSEKFIRPITMGITFFSIFIGSFFLSKNKNEKGLLNGLLLGLSYIILLYLFSVILNQGFYLTINSIFMIIIGIIGGIIGGIAGVNF